MVEIPYLQYDLSMVLLLPRQEKGLLALEQSLSVETLAAWCSDAQMTKVDLCLPKFRFNATYRLKTPLNEMGMKLPFSSQGDFSGITKSEGLTIQEVIHKTFVAVDEKGTEAAAATGVIMPPGMPMPSPLPPKLFRADHPFVFLIKHRNTGAILFTARVAKPE